VSATIKKRTNWGRKDTKGAIGGELYKERYFILKEILGRKEREGKACRFF